MSKSDRKMSKEEVQGLLHMRHREKTHTPKKGKGSFDRNKENQNWLEEYDESDMFQELS